MRISDWSSYVCSSDLNYYKCGELKPEGSSVAEGIGQNRITANLEGAPIDTQFRISDAEGLAVVRRLLDEEGLGLGPSSWITVAGAVAPARTLGPARTCVVSGKRGAVRVDYGVRGITYTKHRIPTV